MVGLVGGISLSNHYQPMPERITALDLTFCQLPCWIGINPGQTTLDEASQYILDAYSDQSKYDLEVESAPYWSFTITQKITGARMRVDLNQIAEQPANATVDEIIFWFGMKSGPDIKFGDLYVELGAPSDLILSAPDDAPYPVVRYDDRQATLSLSAVVPLKTCARFASDQPIEGMTIYSQTVYHQLPINYAWVSKPVVWSGFHACYTFTRD